MTPLLYKDFTIKARVGDSSKTEEILQSIGAELIVVDFQTDHYFEIQNGKLKWRESTIENLITHYERVSEPAAERTIVYRYDLNPTSDQIQDLKQNHKLVGVIKKQRKIYQLLNVKIHLDKLQNEEEFIEIEAIDRDNRFTSHELKARCLEIKSKLLIADNELIPTGYLGK